MLVKDIMWWLPVVAEPSDSVIAAAHLMKSHGVGLLPVVESRIYRELVGVVTDRDLVVRALAGDRGADAHVRDAMTPLPLVTVGPLDDVRDAVQVMDKAQVRRVPVVDQDSLLLGVLSRVDVERNAEISVCPSAAQSLV